MRIFILTVVALAMGVFAGLAGAYFQVGLDNAHRELGSASGEGPAVFPQAKVEVVGGTEFNFGRMELGTTGSHSFVLRNTGNSDLQVTVGDTTCKCTVGKLERSTVGPGETVDVTLEWTPRDFAEVFRQRATILTNDPKRSEVQLTVVGRVDVAVRAVPSSISMGRISVSESRTVTTRIYSYLEEGFRIVDRQFTQPETATLFTSEVRPLTDEELAEDPAARSGYEVAITTAPNLPLGELEQTLELKTDREQIEPLEIPIRGEVAGDITLFGGSFLDPRRNLVMLDLVRRGQGRKVTVFVQVKGPHRDEVQLEVSETNPADVIEARLGERQEMGNGNVYSYPLEITIPPDAPSVSLMGVEPSSLGTIRLKTGHPESPELTISVRVAVEG